MPIDDTDSAVMRSEIDRLSGALSDQQALNLRLWRALRELHREMISAPPAYDFDYEGSQLHREISVTLRDATHAIRERMRSKVS